MIIASISGQVQKAFDVFFTWLPHLIGALIVLIIGYIVAKFVGGLLSRGLHKAGFDRTVHSGQGGAMIQRVIRRPSSLVGRIAFWAIFLGTLSLAASVLGIAALTAFVGAIFAYLPNVIAALIIFLVAGMLAGGVATLAARLMGDTGLGKIVATVAPILIMTIATFMILDQLKIAHDVVVITYAALLGAIALGAALAFGLGGREVAGRMLDGAYATGQANKGQMKQDLQQGKERAAIEKDRLKARVDGSQS